MFFGLFGPDINNGVREYMDTPCALLIDVREKAEYEAGHIRDSINVPLSSYKDIINVSEDFDIPIFVYCHSGLRSSRAAGYFEKMGYRNVKNIGGIMTYRGEKLK